MDVVATLSIAAASIARAPTGAVSADERRPTSPVTRDSCGRLRIERMRALVVFVATLALYAATTHTRIFAAGNDSSRWAHVEALVDLGTASIERSTFRDTVDRVELGGHDYSNKPPLLAIAGAALYAPLEAATGWRLGDPRTAGGVIWLLTVLLSGVPGALTVTLFDRALLRYPGIDAFRRSLLTTALGAGTLLLSFAGTSNNHIAAALPLLAALLVALDGRAAFAGLLAGLSGGIDILPGFLLAPFLAAIVVLAAPRRMRALVGFALGLAVASAVFVAGNVATTGWPLPPKMVPGAVDHSAQAGPSIAGVVLPQSATYPIEILFGAHGLFVVSPVLLFGAAGLVIARRRPAFATARTWAILAAGIVLQIAGHAVLAGSYGGWSYGYRYLIPITPLLLFAAPHALERRAALAAFVALLPLSVLFAALGAYHPWPPDYEQETNRDPIASLVTNPIGGNAAGWFEQHVPGSAVAEGLGRAFVSPDPRARRSYYVLFFASKGDFASAARIERSR